MNTGIIEKRPCPKSRQGSWSEFEKELIEFVRINPILYHPEAKKKLLDSGADPEEAQNRLWLQLGDKWHFTEVSIVFRWNGILRNYYRIKREQNTKAPSYKKYTDGRLVFLDGVDDKIHEYDPTSSYLRIEPETSTSSAEDIIDKEDPAPSSKKQKVSPYKDIEKGISVNKMITSGLKFSAFEVDLIHYVQNFPVIYDPNVVSDDTNSKIQKRICIYKHLENFGKRYDVSVYTCVKTWNRLKMEYFRTRKFQDEGFKPRSSFFKFLGGKFEFLEPTYQFIKIKSINVFEIEADDIDDEIEKRICYWDDFQLYVINFIKKFPVFYDRKMLLESRENVVLRRKALWKELAIILNTTPNECVKCWLEIKDKYQNFIRRKHVGIPNYSEIYKNQYEFMSFICENYFDENEKVPDTIIEPQPSTSKDIQSTTSGKVPESVIVLDDDEPQPSTSKDVQTTTSGKVPDSVIVLDDDEPQPSTSKDIQSIIFGDEVENMDEKNGNITVNDNFINMQKITTKCCEDKPSNDDAIACLTEFNVICFNKPQTEDNNDTLRKKEVNDNSYLKDCLKNVRDTYPQIDEPVHVTEHKDDNATKTLTDKNDNSVETMKNNPTPTHDKETTSDLYKEMGEYLNEKFVDKKQKELRLKSLALLINMDLELLKE